MFRGDLVDTWLASNGYPTLTDEQYRRFALFQERLLAANQYMNLTTITSDDDVAVKHFIDSLTLLPVVDDLMKVGDAFLDLGCGAGFPGLPVLIMRPHISVTLLDARRKKIQFVASLVDELGLEAECVHARAEEMSRQPGHHAAFGMCAARAVAPLAKMAGYTLPLVKPGGYFIAMKGPGAHDEIKAAQKAIKENGGVLMHKREIKIAPDIQRVLVVVRKRGD